MLPAGTPLPAQASSPPPNGAAPHSDPAIAAQPVSRPAPERTSSTRFSSYLPLIVASPRPRTATVRITPEQGGTLTVDALTISVPAGAVTEPTTLTYAAEARDPTLPPHFRLSATTHTGTPSPALPSQFRLATPRPMPALIWHPTPSDTALMRPKHGISSPQTANFSALRASLPKQTNPASSGLLMRTPHHSSRLHGVSMVTILILQQSPSAVLRLK